MVAPSTFQYQVWDKDHQLYLKSILHPHACHMLKRELHLMNLIEMYNIVMTSFNKIKFKYLIQVWEDVMKIIRNVKNVNVKKIL